MTGKLKTMGMALMALLAFGAVTAPGASAQQGVLTSEGPVTLTGEEIGEPHENRVTAFGAFLQCPGSTGTGHQVTSFAETEIEGHRLIAPEATAFTITPHIKEVKESGAPNCIGPLGITATTDFNGCDYVVHAGETTPTENNQGTYGGSLDVVCPPEQEILWTFWKSEEEHTETPETPFCHMHVSDEDAEGNPINQGLTGAHAIDEGNGHIRLVGAINGIHVSRTATHPTLLTCPGNGTTTNATFDLNITVSGHDAEGEETGIALSEE